MPSLTLGRDSLLLQDKISMPAHNADESHDRSSIIVSERSTTPLDSTPASFSALPEFLDRPASVGIRRNSNLEEDMLFSPPRASPLPIPTEKGEEVLQPLSGLPVTIVPSNDEAHETNVSSTSPFGSTPSSSGYGSGGFSPPFIEAINDPSPPQSRPDGWKPVPRPTVPIAQACPTVGYPDPPLTASRNQFCPILKPAASERRAWDSFLKFPPRCLGRRGDPPQSKITEPANQSGEPFDIDKMVEDNAAGCRDFVAYLEARAPGDAKLRGLVSAKEAELKRLNDRINAIRTSSVKRTKYMDLEKKDELEHELFDLKERLALRYADTNKVICQAVQGDYRACRATRCNADFALDKPVTTATTWMNEVKAQDGATDEKREVFIPDWFPVFDSYDIVAFISSIPAKRFLELLNLLSELEQETSALGCPEHKGKGMTTRVWDKQWHDPSPAWRIKFAQKHGG